MNQTPSVQTCAAMIAIRVVITGTSPTRIGTQRTRSTHRMHMACLPAFTKIAPQYRQKQSLCSRSTMSFMTHAIGPCDRAKLNGPFNCERAGRRSPRRRSSSPTVGPTSTNSTSLTPCRDPTTFKFSGSRQKRRPLHESACYTSVDHGSHSEGGREGIFTTTTPCLHTLRALHDSSPPNFLL